MARPVDPDSLGFVITDVGRLLRAAVERRIAERGIAVTPGEARALIHASALNGGRQSLLAERLGVEPMTVSGYVDRLEQRGLVERRVDPADRRAKCVHVTDAADALLEEARAIAASVLAEVLLDVPEKDRPVVEKALKAMRGRLQALLGCGAGAQRQSGAAV
jgi:DNA-binding MarR family transcriptional regulator